MTLNFAVDLASLYGAEKTICAPTKSAATRFVESTGLGGGIAGDLGLEDIVADGLIGLNDTQNYNLYSSSGPSLPTFSRPISLAGKVVPANAGSMPAKVTGSLVFAAPTGPLTPATVNLIGVATLSIANGTVAKYLINWMGAVVPPGPSDGKIVKLSLTGPMTLLPSEGVAPLSLSSSSSLSVVTSGNIDASYDPARSADPLILIGTGTTGIPGAQPFTLSLAQEVAPPLRGDQAAAGTATPPSGGGAPAAGAGGAKGAGAGSSSTGSSSFGSLVDFSIILGLNGGPSWTVTHFKGPGGGGSSGQLLNFSRTNFDSLSITFVPTCQDPGTVPPQIGTYWQSVASCNGPTTSGAAAAAGFQNNTYMIFRNLLFRP